MNKEEYEIIFISEEGRAIKNNKTGKIYYSEFQIIDEKDKEIDRLNNIINELEKWLIEQSEKIWDDNNYLDDVLDKLKELKGE